MKFFSKVFTLALALLSLSLFASADSLQITGVTGVTTPNGAEDVGPYAVSINGTPNNLFCLDLARDITLGETWSATSSVVSTSSPTDVQAAALIINAIDIQGLNPVDGQLEIWALNDLAGAQADGLTAADQAQMNSFLLVATLDQIPGEFTGINSFYSQFTLETAVDGTQSSGGIAQDFLGQSVAATPEPSSLMLFGTGLFGAAGLAFRKARSFVK